MAMQTSGSGPQPGTERHSASVREERGRASEPPRLLGNDDLTWGPAPDAFPAGAQLCLLHGDPGAAGAMFSVRLKASERFLFAPHSHPHDEHVTVISGRLELGDGATADRGSTRTLGPGGYAFLPKDRFHYAWAADDDTVFQVEAIGPFAITYARPEDDPRRAGGAH
jgi:quercetin dioxygenase-like cupin family protein